MKQSYFSPFIIEFFQSNRINSPKNPSLPQKVPEPGILELHSNGARYNYPDSSCVGNGHLITSRRTSGLGVCPFSLTWCSSQSSACEYSCCSYLVLLIVLTTFLRILLWSNSVQDIGYQLQLTHY